MKPEHLSADESPLPVALIHPDELHVEKERPIDAGILQHEIKRPHPAERRRLRTHEVVRHVTRGVRQGAVRHDDLPDAAERHRAEGGVEAGDDGLGSEHRSEVVHVLVECSALWSPAGERGGGGLEKFDFAGISDV